MGDFSSKSFDKPDESRSFDHGRMLEQLRALTALEGAAITFQCLWHRAGERVQSRGMEHIVKSAHRIPPGG